MVTTPGGRARVVSLALLSFTLGLCLFVVVEPTDHFLAFGPPLVLLRIGTGVFGALVTSLMAYINDVRNFNSYNRVYLLFTASFTFACGMEPAVAGYIIPLVGFKALCLGLGGVSGLAGLSTLAFWNLRPKEDGNGIEALTNEGTHLIRDK